jgi:alpha-L-arabinofuranosidase
MIISSLILAAGLSRPIIGFNQNWSYMPNVSDQALIANVGKLKPEMVRYPGGTMTHSFDWRAGKITTRPQKVAQPLSEFKKFVDALKARPIFVLDICNRTLEDQLAMLREAKRVGFAIQHIELGNELYAQDKGYDKVFPSGADYGRRVAEWTPEIKREFPGGKVAALLLARSVRPRNKRMYNWNSEVIPLTRNAVDAYTYHVYIGESGGTYESTSANLERVVARDKLGSKELWITEYGTQKPTTDPAHLTELNKLADFIERLPGVTIALNHQILGGEMNKLSKDGKTMTPEGELFVRRAAARSPRR